MAHVDDFSVNSAFCIFILQAKTVDKHLKDFQKLGGQAFLPKKDLIEKPGF